MKPTKVNRPQLFVKLFVLILTFHCSLFTIHCFSQVGINTNGSTPDNSAGLDVKFSNKGILIPSMSTTDRVSIIGTNGIAGGTPATGLLIYNTECNTFEYYNGTMWVPIYSSSNLLSAQGSPSGLSTVCQNQSGVTYTVASIPGATSYTWTVPSGASVAGSGGQATAALLNLPWGIAVDGAGNVYIADMFNQRIRKITVSTGNISTLAGTGVAWFNGDGIQATTAQLKNPVGVAVDASGNVYIADQSNDRIRKITLSTGIISTVAGTGVSGYSSDGVAATSSQLNLPVGIALDASGNMYIADSGNNRIRLVTVSTGIITTIAGDGISGYAGDGGPGTSAQFKTPNGIAVSCSAVYITDEFNYRVRELCK